MGSLGSGGNLKKKRGGQIDPLVFRGIIILIILIINKLLIYSSGGEPMARVPKVACETISRGTPRLRNLPRNNYG